MGNSLTPFIEFENSLLLPVKLQGNAEEHPDKPALIQNDKEVSWSEMTATINTIANALVDMTIKPGDRVAIMGRNSIEYSQLYCGVIAAGACAVPLSTMINSNTLKLMLEDPDVKAFFIAEEFKELFLPIEKDFAQLKGQMISMDFEHPGWASYDNLLKDVSSDYPAIDIDPDSEFNIIYSSGTTGVPKGIVHTHKIRYAMIKYLYEDVNMSANLVSTPLYSNTTIVCWLPTLYAGGTNVIMPRFKAEEALRLVDKHKVCVAMFVPVQYGRMLQLENFDEYDLSSMESKFCTSAPLREQMKRALLDRFPGTLTEFYGLTEVGPGSIHYVDQFPDRLDSVGQPGKEAILKVIDEDGKVLGPKQIGELVGRNANMSLGYLNREDATKAMHWYDEDGLLYYRSGDKGYIDDEGFVYLLDRKKDMIISGGFNVFATDLEIVLLEHKAVHDAAVVGVESEKWGETPVAFVILENGRNINAKELLDWVNARLNKFQRISQIIFRQDLPKSPIGKVLKRKLREEFKASQ